jgi:hypothetical protein
MGDKLFIYLLLIINHKIFFIYKSCAWKNILANHHQNVIKFNKIQKTFIQINVHFWKNLPVYVIESIFKINFFFSICTSINKIWNIEIDVCAMFKSSMG